MVATEKAGVPAVAIAARSFARAWQSCVDGWGQPNTAFVTIPHATTGQQADFIRNMVDEQIDAIIEGLTVVPTGTGRRNEASSTGKNVDLYAIEMDETPNGLNAVNDFLAERDWSDGIPVIGLKTWSLTTNGDGADIAGDIIQAESPIDAVDKALVAVAKLNNHH